MNAADSITERLERLDRIVDALKANPLAPGIRIFGSALESSTPNDIDCLYEGEINAQKGIGALVRLAFADGNYGYLDPFAIGPDGTLFVRNAERPTWDMARQSTAAGILRAGRAGTPVLEFDRRLADEWKVQRAAADAIIAEAADWYYDVAELYEDLDPEDHLEVVQRAFSSSDCDDFAAVLAEMTGWTPVRAQWSHPDIGFGHHALVQHPNGGMMDVHGWTNENDLRTRYGIKGEITFLSEAISPQTLGDHFDENGIDPIKQRIANVIRALPHAPFLTDARIRTLIQRPLPGVDLPDDPSSPVP